MAENRVWVWGLLSATGCAWLLLGCSSDNSAGGGGGSTASGGNTANGGSTSAHGGMTNGGSPNGEGGRGGQPSGGSANGGAASGGMPSGGAGACVPDYKCKPAAPSTGDDTADCVARVNQFRACACLPPLNNDTEGKACADQQAKYDADQNKAHAGFGAKLCKPDFFAQNECPGYGSVRQTIDGCAQQMFNEGPPPMQPCDGACYQAHGHFINMTGKYKSVTCGFYTTAAGKVWTVQNFR